MNRRRLYYLPLLLVWLALWSSAALYFLAILGAILGLATPQTEWSEVLKVLITNPILWAPILISLFLLGAGCYVYWDSTRSMPDA